MAEDKMTKRARKRAEKEEKKRRKEVGTDDLEYEGESSAGGKIVTFFATLIIILIWLAIVALVIKMDVGGFGSEVLGPVIKDVPYLNKILPEEVLVEESTENPYAYETLEEAIERIKQLEIELAEAQVSADTDAGYIAELEEKAAELEQYKLAEADFAGKRERWYKEVVFSEDAPDINNYKAYYESIDPANAEALYKQVVEQTAYDEEVADYVKTFSSMKPKEAAAIFNTMKDDLKLVAKILTSMDAQARADILGKMDSEIAAKVTEIMEP